MFSHGLVITIWHWTAKSKEIIFRGCRVRGVNSQLPNPIDGIEMIHNIMALGIIVNDQLTSTDHVSSLLASCSSLLYALRLLREHGLPTVSLHDVFRATVASKILYCALAWYSFSSAADLNKLECFLCCCKRSGYCKQDMPTITEQVDDADNSLFNSIIANKHHVQCYLPDNPDSGYNLWPRRHSKTNFDRQNYRP